MRKLLIFSMGNNKVVVSEVDKLHQHISEQAPTINICTLLRSLFYLCEKSASSHQDRSLRWSFAIIFEFVRNNILLLIILFGLISHSVLAVCLSSSTCALLYYICEIESFFFLLFVVCFLTS